MSTSIRERIQEFLNYTFTRQSAADHDNMSVVGLDRQSLENAHAQEQSILFQLPAEVRENIYRHALTCYESRKWLYDRKTVWYRPQYSAPRKSDTTLLLSCKRVYREASYMPFALKDHTFWLTADDRAPPRRMIRERFARILKLVHGLHDEVEIDHVRFFAQMYLLEPGRSLTLYLNLVHFHPKCVTITLRHTDWWYWEQDQKLRIGAKWVSECRLPSSVRSIRMELESLKRKQAQVDSIVKQMKESWYFTRSDLVRLSAQSTRVETGFWRASSTWQERRWIRDEVEPNVLELYMAIVKWEIEPDFVMEDREKFNQGIHLDLNCTTYRQAEIASTNEHINSAQNQTPPASLSTTRLELAGIPPQATAADALAMDQQYLAIKRAAAAGRDPTDSTTIHAIEDVEWRYRTRLLEMGSIKSYDGLKNDGDIDEWRARDWEWRCQHAAEVMKIQMQRLQQLRRRGRQIPWN